MAWVTTDDPQEFLDRAGDFLRARTASNSVPLSVAARLAARQRRPAAGAEAPLFGSWQPSGTAVAGTFIHTPPFPLHLSAPPQRALAPLAQLLARLERRPAGIDAGGELAAAFAAAWTACCPCEAVPALHSRLYRLATLRGPQPAPAGRAAVASAGDRELLVDWLTEFGREVGTWDAGSTPQIDDRLAAGVYTLWRDAAGEPVAVAGVSGAVDAVRRIGPVYTRPDRRGEGFGGAVTAARCRRALDEGVREIVLYADVGNPVSNRLYRRLGFEPVEERRALRFEYRG
ncbi:MAG TPA: GNAT family N-acetyltransferase [Solirubrobacteraceae bacterium]|nr:GNAT family N-acetyltransferase [Solirubrobacteraceae bacterium]